MHASVDCVRSFEAGVGDALARSLPVGDMSRSVGIWTLVFCERNAVSLFVRSIVCAMFAFDRGVCPSLSNARDNLSGKYCDDFPRQNCRYDLKSVQSCLELHRLR